MMREGERRVSPSCQAVARQSKREPDVLAKPRTLFVFPDLIAFAAGNKYLSRFLECVAKHDVRVRYSVCARKYFERVAIEIKPDGAIRRVIHNHRNRAAKGGKRLRNSTRFASEFRKLPPNASECLIGEAGGGQGKVEIDPRQALYADESCNKERLRHSSFGENDGVRSKRSTPNRLPRLLGSLSYFGYFATCLFDCVLDHFGRHIKRDGQCADQFSGLDEFTGQKLVEPAQTFGSVFITCPAQKVPPWQAEHAQAVNDKRSNWQRIRNERISCRHKASVAKSARRAGVVPLYLPLSYGHIPLA
jgi:hypothetical protein